MIFYCFLSPVSDIQAMFFPKFRSVNMIKSGPVHGTSGETGKILNFEGVLCGTFQSFFV